MSNCHVNRSGVNQKVDILIQENDHLIEKQHLTQQEAEKFKKISEEQMEESI